MTFKTKYKFVYAMPEAGQSMVECKGAKGSEFYQPVLVSGKGEVIRIQGETLAHVQRCITALEIANSALDKLANDETVATEKVPIVYGSPTRPRYADGWGRFQANRMVKAMRRDLTRAQKEKENLSADNEKLNESIQFIKEEHDNQIREMQSTIEASKLAQKKEKKLWKKKLEHSKKKLQMKDAESENEFLSIMTELALAQKKVNELQAEQKVTKKKKRIGKYSPQEMMEAGKIFVSTAQKIELAFANLLGARPQDLIGINDCEFLGLFIKCDCDDELTLKTLMRLSNLLQIAERILRMASKQKDLKISLQNVMTLKQAKCVSVTFLHKKKRFADGEFAALVLKLILLVAEPPVNIQEFHTLFDKNIGYIRDFSRCKIQYKEELSS